MNILESKIMEHWNGSDPLVSICCITYNHEEYIEQALEGFLRQVTDFPFEVLIHDDASTDRTAEIIRSYETQYPHIIKPIYQTENQYVKVRLMNPTFNFPRAKGKYIAMCEGDDYWTDPGKLQKQIDFMEMHPDYAMCFHNTICLDETNKIATKPFSNLTEPRDYTLEDLFERNLTNTSAVVYRNIPIKFPEVLAKIAFGDWTLHILHAEHGKIRYMPEVMSIYRIHQGGVWSKRSGIDRIKKTIHMLEKIDLYFTGVYHKAIMRSIGNFYVQLAWEYLVDQEHEKSKFYFQKAHIYGVVKTLEKIKYYTRRYFPRLYKMMRKIKRT